MTARPHLEHVVEEMKSHGLGVGFLHHPEEGGHHIQLLRRTFYNIQLVFLMYERIHIPHIAI